MLQTDIFGAEPWSIYTRDEPVLPSDALRSDQFVPLKLEWESMDDQPPLER
jgi:hypothetical protein